MREERGQERGPGARSRGPREHMAKLYGKEKAGERKAKPGPWAGEV